MAKTFGSQPAIVNVQSDTQLLLENSGPGSEVAWGDESPTEISPLIDRLREQDVPVLSTPVVQ